MGESTRVLFDGFHTEARLLCEEDEDLVLGALLLVVLLRRQHGQVLAATQQTDMSKRTTQSNNQRRRAPHFSVGLLELVDRHLQLLLGHVVAAVVQHLCTGTGEFRLRKRVAALRTRDGLADAEQLCCLCKRAHTQRETQPTHVRSTTPLTPYLPTSRLCL